MELSSSAEFICWLPLGGTWVAVWKDDLMDRHSLHGYWDGSRNHIVIERNCPALMLHGVIVHEYLHAVADHYQVSLKEKDVRILEQGIMQLLHSDGFRSLGV